MTPLGVVCLLIGCEEKAMMLWTIVGLILALVVGVGGFVVWRRRRNAVLLAAAQSAKETNADGSNNTSSLLDSSNSVSVADIQHLIKHLSPNSTYWDVLMAIVSAPENVAWSEADVQRVTAARQRRLQQLQKERELLQQSTTTGTGTAAGTSASSGTNCFDDLVNEGGWDEDDGGDGGSSSAGTTTGTSKERELRAAAADREKKERYDAIKQQHQEAIVLCEGLDEGVLGQEWVERTLRKASVWPPPQSDLQIHGRGAGRALLSVAKASSTGSTFPLIDLFVTAENASVRRMITMVIGRLNSLMLNSHAELVEAGTQQKIDTTYFQASMEFRQRVGMYLEACLRIAMSLRSQRLLATIVETVAMFKNGVKMDAQRTIPWFNTVMTRQYNILPRLKVVSRVLQAATTTANTPSSDCEAHTNAVMNLPPDTPAIATKQWTLQTNQAAEIMLKVERIHAQQFVKVKTEQFQKQGIPVQVGLSTYREGWWFLLRMEQLSGNNGNGTSILPAPDFPFAVDAADLVPFENEKSAHRLVTAWPMMISNIAQELGLLKIQIVAPSTPGSYRYHVGIKSQDFFGADQEIAFNVTVTEPAAVSYAHGGLSMTTATAAASVAVDESNEAKKDK